MSSPSSFDERRVGAQVDRARARVAALFTPFRPELPAWAVRLTPTDEDVRSHCVWQLQLGAGGSATVWLHGIGGTHRYWTCVPSSLRKAGRRNVLIDLLGFGNSRRPWIRYTTEVHLQSLRCAIEKEQEPVTLIGHSLGAILALAYAARYPKQVRALVLIGMPNFGGLPGAAKWFDAKPGGWLYTNMWAMALACVLTRRVAGRVLPHLLKKFPRELAEDMVQHNMASWVTTLWEVLYRADVCSLADHVDPRIPVLLLHGSADRSAPIDGVRILVEQRPAWRLVVLDGVDHHPWLKDSEFCLHIIKQWLDEHD